MTPLSDEAASWATMAVVGPAALGVAANVDPLRLAEAFVVLGLMLAVGVANWMAESKAERRDEERAVAQQRKLDELDAYIRAKLDERISEERVAIQTAITDAFAKFEDRLKTEVRHEIRNEVNRILYKMKLDDLTSNGNGNGNGDEETDPG